MGGEPVSRRVWERRSRRVLSLAVVTLGLAVLLGIRTRHELEARVDRLEEICTPAESTDLAGVFGQLGTPARELAEAAGRAGRLGAANE